MIPLPLLVVAAAVGGWLLFGRGAKKGTDDDHAPEPSEGGSVAGYAICPGVVTSNGSIKISDACRAFLVRLRASIPLALLPTIVIVSGTRSYRSQGIAMLGVLGSGGEAYFRQLYGKAATKLLAVQDRTPGGWEGPVEDCYRTGLLRASGHVGGGAFDARARDLSEAQIGVLKANATSLGAVRVLDESEPARHIHIEVPL